jgi:hypothetical protein
MLQEIERSYYRLVEIEKWMVNQQQYNRPFAHFGLFNGRDARTCSAVIKVPKDHWGKGSRATLKRI